MKTVLAILLLSIPVFGAAAAPKKVKVYLRVADEALTESYSYHFQQAIDGHDQKDDLYKVEWQENAAEAEFIITLFMGKDPHPSIVGRDKNGGQVTCHKYITVTQLWKRGSGKIYEAMNVQTGCDPDGLAEEAASAMELAMGLRGTSANNQTTDIEHDARSGAGRERGHRQH